MNIMIFNAATCHLPRLFRAAGGLSVLLVLGAFHCSPSAGEHASESPAATAVQPEPNVLALPETNIYAIDTPLGTMTLRLYDETPLHRDNFKRLAAEGTLNGTLFHRVINNFMIQGGDPNSLDDDPYNDGQGDPGYSVPAEFLPDLFHKKGALAAARKGDPVNPERVSNGSQFYIVQGSVLDDASLDEIEAQLRQQIPNPSFAFSEEVRQVYKTIGGTPFLDMQYTVFGELIDGLDVLDAIAASETLRSTGQPGPPPLVDRPMTDISITVRAVEENQ